MVIDNESPLTQKQERAIIALLNEPLEARASERCAACADMVLRVAFENRSESSRVVYATSAAGGVVVNVTR